MDVKSYKKTLIITISILLVATIITSSFFLFKDQVLANSSTYQEEGVYAEINTTKGLITVELFYKKTPLTVMNFVGLAEGKLPTDTGKPFYDNLTFHRVVPDFVVQGGDPLGNGTGGPGYSFADEFHPQLKHESGGILSMANSGPDSNGSQFFITLKDTPWLDNRHSVFGKVIAGMKVVNAIEQGDSITTLKIVRVGESAQNFKATKNAFDALNTSVKEQEEKQKELTMEEYIKNNWPKAIKDPNGIYYEILTTGSGPTPKSGQQIKVHYQGKFTNNQVFDDSYQRGEPIALNFGAGQVIPGWELSLATMKKGETRMTIIPPELAYGEKGVGPIPGNSILVFKMELVDIK